MYLSVNIYWPDSHFFTLCEAGKQLAADCEHAVPLSGLEDPIPDLPLFNIRPNGAKGHAWIIHNRQYTLRIGNWHSPKLRPSIFVEIRSETLWQLGPIQAVNKILDFISNLNGKVRSVKPSRVDLCLDFIVPEIFWNKSISDYFVSKATDMVPHTPRKKLEGFSIGKGNFSARLYDKPIEIKKRGSKKIWMYDIWGFSSVPEGKRVIRIEFQLLRESIKQLGINYIDELFDNLDKVWGYCTKNWLRFDNNQGKHHKQRETFPWWECVQNSFMGIHDPEPLIRCKAYNSDISFIQNQLFGALTSLAAISILLNDPTILHPFLSDINNIADLAKKKPDEATKKIDLKLAQYYRFKGKMEDVNAERLAKGHPSNLNQYLTDHE